MATLAQMLEHRCKQSEGSQLESKQARCGIPASGDITIRLVPRIYLGPVPEDRRPPGLEARIRLAVVRSRAPCRFECRIGVCTVLAPHACLAHLRHVACVGAILRHARLEECLVAQLRRQALHKTVVVEECCTASLACLAQSRHVARDPTPLCAIEGVTSVAQ